MSYRDMIVAAAPDLYWRMQESSGNVAVDEMGHCAGTYNGGQAFGSQIFAAGPDTLYNYLGPNAGITANDTTHGDYGYGVPFSVEFWMKPDVPIANYANIVAKGPIDGVANFSGWRIYTPGIGQFYIGVEVRGGTNHTINPSWGPLTVLTQAPGNMSHFVLVFPGTNVAADYHLYMNGVELVGNGAGLNQLLPGDTITSNQPLKVNDNGSSGSSQFRSSSEYMAEFAVYPRAVPLSEAAAHFAVGISGPFGAKNRVGTHLALRSVARPAKDLGRISAAGTKKKKRRKINLGVN